MKHRLFAVLFLILPVIVASGDNLIGPVGAILNPADRSGPVSINPGHLVFVENPGQSSMYAGVKIDIAIPESVATAHGAFALRLYTEIQPRPDRDNERYRGEKITFLLLPPSRRFTVVLPFDKGIEAEESFDVAVVDAYLTSQKYPIGMSITPVMKGLPRRVAESVFQIDVGYFLADSGVARLDITYPGEMELPLELAIDTEPYIGTAGELVLSEGLHTITIKSKHYLDVSRTITVTRGEEIQVPIVLEAKTSTLYIEAPESSVIFLDGEEISGLDPRGREIQPGTHTILIKVADYSLTKSLEIHPGVNYTVGLDMDISFEERN